MEILVWQAVDPHKYELAIEVHLEAQQVPSMQLKLATRRPIDDASGAAYRVRGPARESIEILMSDQAVYDKKVGASVRLEGGRASPGEGCSSRPLGNECDTPVYCLGISNI